MKKLLYLILFISSFAFGQTIENNKIVFREEFRDEFSVRFNGGIPTDVTFSNGIGTFNGTSSKIVYPLTYSSSGYTVSVRAKRGTISDTYAVLFGYQANYAGIIVYENGDIVMTSNAGNLDNIWSGIWADKDSYHLITFTVSGIGAGQNINLHFDGVAQGASSETTYTIDGFVIGEFVTAAAKEWIGDIDLAEIYNYALSAEEVSNLYNNRRFRDIGQANEILNVSAQSGSIIDRQGNTLINTATTVFKDGDANVMLFNGSTSKIDCGDPDGVGMIGDRTFVAWVKYKTVGEGGFGMIFYNARFYIYTQATNLMTVSSNNSTFKSSNANTFEPNIWTLICLVRASDGTTSLYKNGEVLASFTDQDTGTPIAGIVNLHIGARNTGTNTFDGFISDARIIDGILTAAKISQIYTAEKHMYAK